MNYENKYKPSFVEKVKLWIHSYGLHCITIYRFGQFSKKLLKTNKLLGFIPWLIHVLLNYMMRLLHHVEIRTDTIIGKGFYMGHSTNIQIDRTHIGENCSINHNVTIGESFTKRDDQVEHGVAKLVIMSGLVQGRF